MNIFCRFGAHKKQYPVQMWIDGYSATTESCIRCGRVFWIKPVYLPPPFKYMTSREIKKACESQEIIPCAAIHIGDKNQVDYFVIKANKN